MTSWRRSSDRSHRSASPATPPVPISPTNLPQWLLPGKGKAVIPPGKYKILLAALGCIMLGWLMTSMLSPELQESPQQPFEHTYTASTGYLNDPTGFGADVPSNRTQHASEVPTIKGALEDLHKAMSDKISGWRGHTPHNGVPSNVSALSEPKVNTTLSTGEYILDGQTDDERLGARTRIGKCTMLFNGNSLWERAIKSHEAHNKLHGYRLHVLRQEIFDGVWNKIAYILSLILRELAKPESEQLEWLLWVDADTILLNPHIPIEAFLPPAGSEFEHVHLLYSNDWNGLNSGVFPIRVNKWSAELLSAILAFRYYRPDEPLTFREQSAMDIVMKEPKFSKNIVQLPQRWFNAYMGEHNETLAPHQIRRGDMLVHFAGVIERDKFMAIWLDRAEEHMDDWEIPYKSTSYPQEIRDFWAAVRSAREGQRSEIGKARLAATELMTEVDGLIGSFGERLSGDQLDSIKKAKSALGDFMGKGENSEDLAGMDVLKSKLEAVSTQLQTAKKESHKVLLASAHEAIFAGEKDLLEFGFYKGKSNHEADEIDNAVKSLKEMVLSAEDKWDRQKISSAVNGLTAARGRLKEKSAAIAEQEAEMAEKKAEEAEKSKALQAAQALAAAEDIQGESGHHDTDVPDAVPDPVVI
ncbi:hypothetical protein AMS68_002222 [Peltaster fructicola]|uniref:Glycosyltransferase family 34 protein n=1 Tax=Peltaster fructicola TaxID=286661 RepID=A0A6H0XPZ6_9PEZI|nr:hypothetical protein AMS68_002222 [Peltaster fructicola]